MITHACNITAHCFLLYRCSYTCHGTRQLADGISRVGVSVAGPPSEPRHLIVNAVSSNSVTLDWSPPLDLGGRTDLQYRVVCAECGNDVLYSPGWYGFNTTR